MLSYIEHDGAGIETLRRESTTLQNLPAVRIAVRYRDRDSGATMIQDAVVSRRSERWQVGLDEAVNVIFYTLVLTTPEFRYTRDKELFERIISTWRIRPLDD